MAHKTRSARKSNKLRKKKASEKQAVLPVGEQQKRAEDNKRAGLRRYPKPPIYCHADGRPYAGPQPACYNRVMW